MGIITGRKRVLITALACWLGYGLSSAAAQQSPSNEDVPKSHISVNGWDLRVSESHAPTTTDTGCTLSATMLSDPPLGLQGGRMTVGFAYSGNGIMVTVTVSGGADKQFPIEIWVDNHRIADQNSTTGTISFSPKISASVVTLFKAGRYGFIRFRRNGKIHDVPLSLNGFTKAARAFRTECIA